MYLQSHIYKNIPVSFDFITTWNQGAFLCSPCITSEAIEPSDAAGGGNWGSGNQQATKFAIFYF